VKQYNIQNRSPNISEVCVPLSREVEKHEVTRRPIQSRLCIICFGHYADRRASVCVGGGGVATSTPIAHRFMDFCFSGVSSCQSWRRGCSLGWRTHAFRSQFIKPVFYINYAHCTQAFPYKEQYTRSYRYNSQ
jgi:hypothetical protein